MIRFNVPDMHCGSCAGRIERALAQAGLSPELEVHIDVATRSVLLPTATADEARAVRAAIAAAGYTAEPVAPAAAQTRQGGCCCASRRAAAACC